MPETEPEDQDPGQQTVSTADPRSTWIKPLVVACCLLLLMTITLAVVLVVLVVGDSSEDYQNARRLLWLVRMDPENVIYSLRSTDSSGKLLQSAIGTVADRDPAELDELLAQISKNLMGEDQVAWFTGTNRLGGDNAGTLGYYDACLDLAGIEEQPWPENPDGTPYDGASETAFDIEFSDVLYENR
ncbi:MAG: hypothetical protein KKF41_07835 [Actinobacteria bacterium]|nr:hypothetical protein [Actinomycetota bacterium]MBU1944161.1 hypothetical protein [Actinomycetota bacterium]MBU2687480.1 hypothetical protein [Actinomycetota bacterium]